MDILELIKDFGPIIVVLTFIKATYEYIKGLKWKKSEFLSKEVKEFFNDSNVKNVCLLLDWNTRKIELNGETIIITDEMLYESLQTHDVKSKFKIEEAKLRDMFDSFFDKLSYFNIHIKNGLVDKKQVLLYLSYYLDILSTPGRKPKKLVETFNKYIDYYGYQNIREILDLHKKSPNGTFSKLVDRFF